MKKDELKYKVIKTDKQYYSYCDHLEDLLNRKSRSVQVKEEIALLTLLIETWDEAHNTFEELDPIELLKGIMAEHQLKSKDMVHILGVSKGMVSQILNKKKGLSKEVIRNLAERFKMTHEAFNRPYQLVSEVNKNFRYANLMNTPKDITPKIIRKSA